jgi:hypothetical protein
LARDLVSNISSKRFMVVADRFCAQLVADLKLPAACFQY